MPSTRVRRTGTVPPITFVGRALACCLALCLAAPLSAQAAGDTPDTTATASGTSAPVAARAIPRGVELVAEDIEAVAGAADRRGWVTRRVIHAGEPLTKPAVVPPPVVRAGEIVQYIVEQRGIQLAIQGTALADASLGETLPVRLDATRRVQAVVAGPGRVVARDGRRQR